MNSTTKSLHPEELLEQLHDLLILLFASTSFEERWQKVCEQFLSWARGLPAPISTLTRNLELLRLICQNFNPTLVKQNVAVLHIILDGTLEMGNSVQIRGDKYEVINREIGSNFGITYTLKNKQGNIIRHEFFD